MDRQPDLILEKDKSTLLPPSLNSASIINNLPFSVGIELNHTKFLQPTITLLPVTKKDK